MKWTVPKDQIQANYHRNLLKVPPLHRYLQNQRYNLLLKLLALRAIPLHHLRRRQLLIYRLVVHTHLQRYKLPNPLLTFLLQHKRPLLLYLTYHPRLQLPVQYLDRHLNLFHICHPILVQNLQHLLYQVLYRLLPLHLRKPSVLKKVSFRIVVIVKNSIAAYKVNPVIKNMNSSVVLAQHGINQYKRVIILRK